MDPQSQSVEQARQQIQDLLADVEALADTDLSNDQFFVEFLNRAVTGLAAVGGVIWLADGHGTLSSASTVSFEKTRLPAELDGPHAQLVHQVFATGEGRWIGTADETDGGGDGSGGSDGSHLNPTPYLLLLAPISDAGRTVGVVEVVQRVISERRARDNYQRLLERMSKFASTYLKNGELRAFKRQKDLFGRLDRFQQTVHASLDIRATAYAIANEGRHVIDCDRVTVVVDRGGKLRAEAVSGQDTFDDRSAAIRSLVKLARSVGGMDEPLWYPQDSGKLPPHLEEAVERYVDEADSTTLSVLPMHDRRLQSDPTANQKSGQRKPDLIGVLIVESFEGENSPGFEQRVIAVRDAASSALANAVQHQSVFMLPVWQSMGNAGRALRAPKAIFVAAFICAAILALFIVPADFQMEANGELQPVLKNDVFAATDGIVDVVVARHGETVRRGQLLVQMTNARLESELARLEGDRSTTVERLRSVRTLMLKNRRMSNAERDRLYSQQTEIEQSLAGIEGQIVVHKKSLEQLNTTSPVDGQVVTWNVQETLHRRPIQRGQLLMTVAQPDGPWQLEIRMPEGQMGHVLRAQAENGRELGVRYMLASEPGRTYHGSVREVHDRAEVRGAEGSSVLMKVAIDRNDLQHLKPGAEVVAKVECGRRSIGYVWFHEVFEFVQSKILFRI